MASAIARTPVAATSLVRGLPQYPEGSQSRRQGSLDRGPTSAERSAVAVGRTLVGTHAAPRNTSRDKESARIGQHVGLPLRPKAAEDQQHMPATRMLPRVAQYGLVDNEGDSGNHAVDHVEADSLAALLKKPLLPQNGQTHLRPNSNVQERARRGHSDPPSGSYTRPAANFDEEARKLWARLNLDPTKDNNQYNSLDPLWRHPETGSTFYVGNEVAAKSLQLLQKHNITHVVNCTDSIPNYHDRDPSAGITYYRFDITSHYHRVRSDKEAVAFAQPMLNFTSDALSRGKNVMVHCLAGAHRAGTTGIMCLMYFAKLNQRDATYLAKQCRPIIDPICDFPTLLARLERGWLQA